MILVHDRIRQIRKQKGVTKAFVARALGLTAMGYHHLESGRSPISTDRLQIIAKVLSVDPREFLCPDVNELVSSEKLA